MRIAVASEGLNVAKSFASCPNVNYYTTSSYEIAETQNLPVEGLTLEEHATLMEKIGVDVLLVNNISHAALNALGAKNIRVLQGFTGSAFDAATTYLSEQAATLESEFPEE